MGLISPYEPMLVIDPDLLHPVCDIGERYCQAGPLATNRRPLRAVGLADDKAKNLGFEHNQDGGVEGSGGYGESLISLVSTLSYQIKVGLCS